MRGGRSRWGRDARFISRLFAICLFSIYRFANDAGQFGDLIGRLGSPDSVTVRFPSGR